MMEAATPGYARLAALLAYPDDGLPARAAATAAELEPWCPETAKRLRPFVSFLAGRTTAELEELYTRTFDINPGCSLEVGWHLFGEQYERGAFLVRMRQTLRRLGIPEGRELPDHLTLALEVLSRLSGEEADTFAGAFLLPALAKMREVFPEDNAYRPVLDAIWTAVRARHRILAPPVAPRRREGGPVPERSCHDCGS